MKHALRLWAIVAIGAIAYASVPANAAVPRGSIRGCIVDGRGNPLAGAAVLVLAETEESKPARIIKRANSDSEGKFVAADITPGRYRVKAAADGFKPVELDAEVRPNKATVFDSILLRRINTLAEETSLNNDSKYAARGARNMVFHYDGSKKTTTETSGDETVALTDRTPEFHGVIN